MKIVTVVPGPKGKNGIHMANGTKVVLDDGSELQNIQQIALYASAGGVWTACITVVLPTTPEITALDLSLPDAAPNRVTNAP